MSGNTRRDLAATLRVLITFLLYPVGIGAAGLVFASTRTASRTVMYAAWSLTGAFALLAGCRAMMGAARAGNDEDQQFIGTIGKLLAMMAGLTGILIILMVWRRL